jgi:hypothetical protein
LFTDLYSSSVIWSICRRKIFKEETTWLLNCWVVACAGVHLFCLSLSKAWTLQPCRSGCAAAGFWQACSTAAAHWHCLLVLGPSACDEQQNKRLSDRPRRLDGIWTDTSHEQTECCICVGRSNTVIWPWNIAGHWCDIACRGPQFGSYRTHTPRDGLDCCISRV